MKAIYVNYMNELHLTVCYYSIKKIQIFDFIQIGDIFTFYRNVGECILDIEMCSY